MCGGMFQNLLIPVMDQRQLQAEAGLVAAKRSELSCPSCRKPVSAEFDWCPHCGTALRAQPCAYCGRLMAPAEPFCSSCGAPRKERA